MQMRLIPVFVLTALVVQMQVRFITVAVALLRPRRQSQRRRRERGRRRRGSNDLLIDEFPQRVADILERAEVGDVSGGEGEAVVGGSAYQLLPLAAADHQREVLLLRHAAAHGQSPAVECSSRGDLRLIRRHCIVELDFGI